MCPKKNYRKWSTKFSYLSFISDSIETFYISFQKRTLRHFYPTIKDSICIWPQFVSTAKRYFYYSISCSSVTSSFSFLCHWRLGCRVVLFISLFSSGGFLLSDTDKTLPVSCPTDFWRKKCGNIFGFLNVNGCFIIFFFLFHF